MYNIYLNIAKMLTVRGGTLTANPVDEKDFSNLIVKTDYVVQTATRSAQDIRGEALIACVLLTPYSKYEQKTDTMKILIKALGYSALTTKCEVIIVTSEDLSSHIRKYLAVLNTTNISYEHYVYKRFKVDIRAHCMVADHTIASSEEIEHFCSTHYTSADRFPMIRQGIDPQCIWLGAREGMVIKIKRLSESAGNALAYRRVVL